MQHQVGLVGEQSRGGSKQSEQAVSREVVSAAVIVVSKCGGW